MVSDIKFREYKKFAVGLTHRLEHCVDIHKELVRLVDNGGFNEGQELELKEYNDRIGKCMNYLSKWATFDDED